MFARVISIFAFFLIHFEFFFVVFVDLIVVSITNSFVDNLNS